MRRAVFTTYQPKTILNKGKRADHWFWTRYSAYPYIGCQHGCVFCYCRERKFSPYDDPEDFAYKIKAKMNAPTLLRKSLARAPIDAVFTGDYQPLERKYLLSRQILEVCLELGFPVFVLERSPLVLRDLDLLQSIHKRARTTVAFSIITTPDSVHYSQVCDLERLAPPAARRFAAMEKIAAAGITTGTCFMPALPGLCASDEDLEQIVRWTAEHGGSFVLGSGLTLSDQQRQYFMDYLSPRFPELLKLYQSLYPAGSYGASGDWWQNKAVRLREVCEKYGISDRAPRPIISGEKRAFNKRVVEILANRVYALELERAPEDRIWLYRKAAWAVEDLEQDLRLIYKMMGLAGLQSIPEINPGSAVEIEKLIILEASH